MINKKLLIAAMAFVLSFGLVAVVSADNFGFPLDEYGHPTQAYLDSQEADGEGIKAASNADIEKVEKLEVRCVADYALASRSTLTAEPCWDMIGS